MALLDLLPSRQNRTEGTPETPSPEPPSPTPPEPTSHRGLLEIGGMFPITWDTAYPVTVSRAAESFYAAIRSGYVAQSYTPAKVVGWGGSRMDGEVTREFNPEADVVRMSLPYAGG